MPSDDPWYFWRSRLAGRDYVPDDLLNTPQPGFYRDRNKGVAYARDDRGLVAWEIERAQRRQLSEAEALARWPWVAWNAVSEETFRRVELGGDWDDEAPGLGHNRPPADDPELGRAIMLDAAETWLKQHPEVSDQKRADQAADFITKLRRELTDLKHEEAVKISPFKAFIETMREQYRVKRTPLEQVGIGIKAALQPWLEQLKQDQESDRERIHADDRARRAEGKRIGEERPPTARAGKTGSAVTLRTVRTATITDYLTALEHAGAEEEVVAAVQKIADRKAKATKEGMTEVEVRRLLLPGTTLNVETRI